MSARLFAPGGTPDHSSGGATSAPSQVYSLGIGPSGSNAEDLICSGIARGRTEMLDALQIRGHGNARVGDGWMFQWGSFQWGSDTLQLMGSDTLQLMGSDTIRLMGVRHH